MTTMLQAVTRAARMLGIVRAGQVPKTHDANDILAHMQGVIDTLPHFRSGAWCDVLLSSSTAYTARDGQRISLEGFAPVITLPTKLNRAGDPGFPRDLSRIHIVGKGIYVWSSTLGSWNKTDGLGLGDPFPFGDEDLPGIAAMTAIIAAAEYGATIDPATMLIASRTTASLRSRFYRPRPPLDGCCTPADGCFRDYV